MSYHTQLQIRYDAGCQPLDIDSISEQVLVMLKADGVHHAVYEDMRDALLLGDAEFGVPGFYLRSLLERITALMPASRFIAYCTAEEPDDSWVCDAAALRNSA